MSCHESVVPPHGSALPVDDSASFDTLDAIFKKLDSIAEPKKSTLKKEKPKSRATHSDKKPHQHIELVQEINVVLRKLHAVQVKNNACNIATLFYERMVSSQKLLSESQVLHYQQILSLYVDVASSIKLDDQDQRSLQTLAQNILSYLNSHTVDPDSALIGLPPSDDMVLKLSDAVAGDLDHGKTSKEDLIKQIVRWSHMHEGEAVLQAVRECAASFRGVDRLRRGEVAVVRLSSGKFVFGRATGERTDNFISCHVDPMETSVVPIHFWDVWPLTKSITDSLKEVKAMEKIIRQPVETFFAALHQEVKALTLRTLASMGIDVAVTDRATELKVTLYDLDDLKFITAKLTEIHADTSIPMYKQVEGYIQEKVSAYISQLERKNMFMPKYKATMQVLHEYPRIPLARSRVRQLLGTCELALDQLVSTDMRRILNGAVKAQITEWWLKKIETKVNDFLRFHGYEFTAVPDNYIEQPPDNLESVRVNLVIVTKTLDPATYPEFSPLSLIKELRDEIYPVIDDFMRTAIITLCDHLELEPKSLLNLSTTTRTADLTTNDGNREPADDGKDSQWKSNSLLSFDASAAIPILKRRMNVAITSPLSTSLDNSATLSASSSVLFEQLGELIRDLEYLGSMKSLEDNPNPEEKTLHIVPVGGLVVGSFLRLENELKTVIELWDMQEEDEHVHEESVSTEANSEEPTYSKVEDIQSEHETRTQTEDDATATEFVSDDATELHWAVCSGESEKVRETLGTENGRSTVNTPDPHGWTPLHMASVLGNWDICEILLEIPDINVSLVNEKGSAPLHYIVKHPYNPQQATVIDKILVTAPSLAFLKNHHGETPLHSASLKANHKVVSLLVGYPEAPVNSLTIGGETPLHYAVTVGDEITVNTLLKAGSDPSIQAKRGTPLDLALGYKHFGIASTIRKALGIAEDLGWPRTTRTPPGQHIDEMTSIGLPVREELNSFGADSDSSEGATRPFDSPTIDRHIQIGTRQPRRKSKARSILPDKPMLLNLPKHSEGSYIETQAVLQPPTSVLVTFTAPVNETSPLVDINPAHSLFQVTSTPKPFTDVANPTHDASNTSNSPNPPSPALQQRVDTPSLQSELATSHSSPQLSHSRSSPLLEQPHPSTTSRSLSAETPLRNSYRSESTLPSLEQGIPIGNESPANPPAIIGTFQSSSPSQRWTAELKSLLPQHNKRHSQQASPPQRSPYLQFATDSLPVTKVSASWIAPSSVPSINPPSPGWHTSATPTPPWHTSPSWPEMARSPSPTPSPPTPTSPNWQTASPPNWHSGRVRGAESKRAMALRAHNKTLSDGNMPFLSKIQPELLASSVPTSSFRSPSEASNFRSHSSDEVNTRVHSHTLTAPILTSTDATSTNFPTSPTH